MLKIIVVWLLFVQCEHMPTCLVVCTMRYINGVKTFSVGVTRPLSFPAPPPGVRTTHTHFTCCFLSPHLFIILIIIRVGCMIGQGHFESSRKLH